MFWRRSRRSAAPARVRIASLDASFEVPPNQTVLDGALAADVQIPFSCRVGSCGTCVCRIVAGRVKPLTEFSYVLSHDELAAGYVLACQSVPLDQELELEIGKATPNPFEPARLAGAEPIAEGVYRVTLRPDRWAPYEAGQYIDVRPTKFGVARPYSFATSAARAEGNYELCVKKRAGGLVSTWLTDPANVGAQVMVSAPRGTFRYRRNRPVSVFAAGGSGIGPIKAMLESISTIADPPIVYLYYGARDRTEIAHEDALRRLREKWRSRFELHFVLSSDAARPDGPAVRGRVTEHVGKVPELITGSDLYICGGDQFVAAVARSARERGMPAENIHAESFSASSLVREKGA